jgi:2-polyprenyl-3-methyl-5-hydroxy-6-metoxy-1,4-benzoquinol methylase
MLKNDQVFWQPDDDNNAPYLSWGSSGGAFDTLWNHAQVRWKTTLEVLTEKDLPHPRGKIVEFGSGMGLLDDLLGDLGSTITMLDHTSDYISQRPKPLSPRCRHVLWSAKNLQLLQSETPDYDWLLSIAVFYHVDDPTAVALIREIGTVLRPGGHVLIRGFTVASVETMRLLAERRRLFRTYPTYALNLDLLRDTLAPDYEELYRDNNVLVYRKRDAG